MSVAFVSHNMYYVNSCNHIIFNIIHFLKMHFSSHFGQKKGGVNPIWLSFQNDVVYSCFSKIFGSCLTHGDFLFVREQDEDGNISIVKYRVWE